MRVTVVPASTKSGVATIRSLLSKPVQVRGIYRDLSKIPATFSADANFSAIEGNASDEGALDLTGSDAVLAIIPPVFDGRDPIEHAKKLSSNIKTAIEMAGNVKILVLLSSGGAEFSEGVVRIQSQSLCMILLITKAGRNQDKQQSGRNTSTNES
jgi:putative NADH-flavin reductase